MNFAPLKNIKKFKKILDKTIRMYYNLEAVGKKVR